MPLSTKETAASRSASSRIGVARDRAAGRTRQTAGRGPDRRRGRGGRSRTHLRRLDRHFAPCARCTPRSPRMPAAASRPRPRPNGCSTTSSSSRPPRATCGTTCRPTFLRAASPDRGRRIRRSAARLCAGVGAHPAERAAPRRAAAATLHHRVPVDHAADDGRAVGVAERAEARARRARARARRRAGRAAHPSRAGGPHRRPASTGGVDADTTGRADAHPALRHPPAAAIAGARERRRRCGARSRAGARREGPLDRGRDHRRRPPSGVRAGGDGQPDRQPAPHLVVRLERVLRERQPGRAGAAARSGRRLRAHGFPQPRPVPARDRGAGRADGRRRSCASR